MWVEDSSQQQALHYFFAGNGRVSQEAPEHPEHAKAIGAIKQGTESQ
jgi:hypothetical protein